MSLMQTTIVCLNSTIVYARLLFTGLEGGLHSKRCHRRPEIQLLLFLHSSGISGSLDSAATLSRSADAVTDRLDSLSIA